MLVIEMMFPFPYYKLKLLYRKMRISYKYNIVNQMVLVHLLQLVFSFSR